MTVQWVQDVKAQITAGQIDPFDTKEDAEVLIGLFLGDMVYEQIFDFHIAKQSRIIQALG